MRRRERACDLGAVSSALMSRRIVARAAAGVIAGLLALPGCGAQPSPPNIVLIVTDDQAANEHLVTRLRYIARKALRLSPNVIPRRDRRSPFRSA